MNELNALAESARAAFAQAVTPAELENAKALFLGKSGRITELMKALAALPVEEKKSRGAAINLVKQAIVQLLADPVGDGCYRNSRQFRMAGAIALRTVHGPESATGKDDGCQHAQHRRAVC